MKTEHIVNFEKAQLSRYLLAIRQAKQTDRLAIKEQAYDTTGKILPGHYALEFRGERVNLSEFWKTFETLSFPIHPRVNLEAIRILFRRAYTLF
jgi:hypothetical protein